MNEQQLISFGNFLLSEKRTVSDILKGEVTHADLENWKEIDKSTNWISVKDRLPYRDGEDSVYCLVYSTYDGIVVRPYNEHHKCWDLEDGDDHYCDAVDGKVTHWMELPEKPV